MLDDFVALDTKDSFKIHREFTLCLTRNVRQSDIQQQIYSLEFLVSDILSPKNRFSHWMPDVVHILGSG